MRVFCGVVFKGEGFFLKVRGGFLKGEGVIFLKGEG